MRYCRLSGKHNAGFSNRVFSLPVRIVGLYAYMISVLFVAAGTGAVNTGMEFLNMSQGIRASAMGSAYVANAQGPVAVYYNPAGAANTIFNEARAVYNSWIDGVYYTFAGYRQTVSNGGICLSVAYLNSGSMPERISGRDTVTSNYTLEDLTVDAAYGLIMKKNINLGIAVKYMQEKTAGDSFSGLSLGMGMQYKYIVEGHYINAGISLLNLGPSVGYWTKDPLPAVIKAGISDELIRSKLTASSQVDYYIRDSEIKGGAGIEVRVASFLELRCGYKFGYGLDIPYGLTYGVGLNYIENMEYIFEYSVTNMQDLGWVNRAGVGVKF